jgi:hypothetical protein
MPENDAAVFSIAQARGWQVFYQRPEETWLFKENTHSFVQVR